VTVELARHTGRSFDAAVRAAAAAGRLVVQPRMGFGDAAQMRAGLLAVAGARAATVGTITIDSYTRTGNLVAAERAIAGGQALNGFPLATHGRAVTGSVIRGVGVPIQVRHGSPTPQPIIRAMLLSGMSATEGGPVSYCLPYGRIPLAESLANWDETCDLLAAPGVDAHVETFGGCMLGQLCPPGLLVALSLLEGLYFAQRGIGSVSLSYAQQTNERQDLDAVLALRGLAAELLSAVDHHVVVYTYMGVYPRTEAGARLLNDSAARLAARTGAMRLIVKTTAEAFRIPTIEENVAALESAATAATAPQAAATETGEVRAEARALVDAVLDLDDDVGRALAKAFALGVLDLPFCLHPDNRGLSRSYLDVDGELRWSDIGRMPVPSFATTTGSARLTSSGLLRALTYVERKFDDQALSAEHVPELETQTPTTGDPHVPHR